MARPSRASLLLGYLLESAIIFKTAYPMVYEGKKTFHCRDNRFSIGSFFTAQNLALLGHVDKSIWTRSLLHCNQLCLAAQDWCISVNFNTRVDQETSKNLCELNNYGIEQEEEFHGNKFERKNGFIFSQIRPAKYGCPCQNGGKCDNDCASFEVKCRCAKGFYGTKCEHIDDCQGITCQHGGTCQDSVNNYTCSCVPGYTGRHCENDINECQGVSCQNGGTCQDLLNNFICSCVPGYTGRYCESDINECASTPCLNGGTCHNQLNQFSCTCPSTHHGHTCNKVSTCDITYASYSTNNYILYPWTKAAYAMTFCTWTQLTYTSSVYPASLTYSNRGVGVIYQADGTILLRIDYSSKILSMGIKRDGKWQHLCIAWRNTDGKVASYRNGQLIDSQLSFYTGGSIVGSGNLNICRRSDLGAAFVGKISNFNIWSSFLSANQILSMASSCQSLTSEGDLVSWSEVKKKNMYGQVSKACPGTCYV